MHELSIALAILDIAEEEAGRRSGRVAAIHLKLGRLSGVVEEALRSAFEMAREGTSLAQSELVIENVPLVVHCAACNADGSPGSLLMLCCPTCGKPAEEVVSGRELEVFALEMEP
jgi:hydrogenase nickel incorporation protein HypA/HybF